MIFNVILWCLFILLAALFGVAAYYKFVLTKYWDRRGVPSLKPHLPIKVFADPGKSKAGVGEAFKRFYDSIKSRGLKHGGLCISFVPIYMPIDPKIVGNILVRDFNSFTERGLYYDEDIDPLWANLLVLRTEKWKVLRPKLTPSLSSAKIKSMFKNLLECSHALSEIVENHAAEGKPVNVKQIMCSFAIDVIGSCAFGLECNSIKDQNSEFRRHGLSFYTDTIVIGIKSCVGIAAPWLARLLRFRAVSKDDTDFFLRVVKETIEYRIKNNYTRRDFLQLMIDMDKGNDAMSTKEIAAQVFIFFAAGFETVASTLLFCLYELAINQHIQERLQSEIKDATAKYRDEITYDALQDMKYMQQVIDETLRKYPPVPVTMRECTQDYAVEGTDVVLEKGTRVMPCIFGMHRDPDYFPSPEVFDPERFNSANKEKIRPFTYMPFGDGPRSCIGARFAVIEAKVCLSILLRQYRFTLDPRTPVPLRLCPRSILLGPAEPVLLNVAKLQS
ncbi:cytochrome p450 [Rhyzopertha dominica]|nr:cytochrome p450 [Rhyzopertha dominica]